MRRALTAVVCAIIIAAMLAPLLPTVSSATSSTTGSWKLIKVYWRSSADTSKIYPGSKNVELTVVTKYVGLYQAKDVAACINLPPGFSISRGFSPCSPPYEPNTSKSYTTVSPGDVVIFRYHIDISKSVLPGSYGFTIDVNYVINNTSCKDILRSYIVVSPYPKLNLVVTDWYWSPTAYPGSAGVTLSITLTNNGESTIESAHIVVRMPKGIFTPSTARADIGTLPPHNRVTISIRNIYVSTDAVPNKGYPITIEINATARTKDGVTYTATENVSTFVSVSKAPPVKLVVVSYGSSIPRTVNGQKLSRIYIEFQNMDFVTIRSITAYFHIISGATFANGSRDGYATLSGSYGYGSFISIRSPEIVVRNNTHFIYLRLNLSIFGSRNGADFWVSQVYYLRIPVETPRIELSVVKSYWSTQIAYPGSSSLTLNIVIRNNDIVDLSNAVATLTLPRGFSPRNVTVSSVSIASGSQVTLSFRGIDIDNATAPGTYLAKLVVDGLARSGSSFYPVKIVLPVPIQVSQRRSGLLKVVSAVWRGGRFYTTSVGQSFTVELRVVKPATVSNVVIEVHLPMQLSFFSGNRTKVFVASGSYGYGSVMRIDIGRIYSATDTPGMVPVVIVVKALADIHGAQQWIEETFTLVLPIEKPLLNLSIVSAKWGSTRCSGSCKGETVRVSLQSLDLDTINTMIVNATIVSGGRFESGSISEVFTWSGSLNYGEITTLSIGPLDVHGSNLSMVLHVCAYLALGGGKYRACTELRIGIGSYAPKPLVLNSVQTLMNGAYAPILPNQKGITVRVLLTNIGTSAISSIKVSPALPNGFHLRRVYGSCLSGVASGATCSIDLELDTSSDLSPGSYTATLGIMVIERLGQSIQIVNESIEIPLEVQSPQLYSPRISIVTWFWGRAQPQTVFEYEKHVPLTIVLSNDGRYAAQSVIVSIEPLNASVSAVMNRAVCANTLAPHTTCTVTTFFNVGRAGLALFRVVVSYEITSYGTLIPASKEFTVGAYVSKFAGGRGLSVVSSGWSNSWPVYPGTQNATYTITLANMWPYTVSGINLTLYLPKGFSHKGQNCVTAYIPGPIRSFETFTASFTVTVGRSVAPGIYRARLVASYVVNVGGSQLRWVETRAVKIEVNSLSNAVALVTARWIGSSPEPGTYGASLALVFRNNYVPSMKGVVLKVELPKGFTCSINNESKASIPPISVSLTPSMPTASSVQAILSALASQGSSSAQSAGKGQFITFVVPLNILVRSPGTYYANATLNFIDQWGNVREVRFVIPIHVLGFTKIIKVEPLNQLSFENATSTLSLLVENVGSSPLYDTYIYVVPRSPIAIPRSVAMYIGTLPPKSPIVVNVTLVYNPFSVVSMGGMAVSYQSLPLVVSFSFRDALGYHHVFNTSVSVTIKPFIFIALGSDTKARYRSGSVVVSGTVINYGITTAHSVWVYACAEGSCSSTFVGDIDEASQAAFRVELNVARPVKNIELKVTYIDNYGASHARVFVLPVAVENITTATTTVTQGPVFTLAHGIVIAVVAIFLAGVGIAIARYLKRHGAREGV
ncbi:MAG: hypothetical protein GXO32_01705 [Crenarchaeota archaeon]|nr:hypothetical protein [Thermoproteota archaeon]